MQLVTVTCGAIGPLALGEVVRSAVSRARGAARARCFSRDLLIAGQYDIPVGRQHRASAFPGTCPQTRADRPAHVAIAVNARRTMEKGLLSGRAARAWWSTARLAGALGVSAAVAPAAAISMAFTM